MVATKVLTPTERVQRANVSFMSHKDFIAYAGVIMLGTFEVRKDCPTAKTDGKNVVYGEDFIAGLNEPQLRAVVFHENLHKMFCHLLTWGWMWELNPQAANMAADYVINLIIYDASVKNPDMIQMWTEPAPLLDEKYRGKASPEVFWDLMKQTDNCPSCGGTGKTGSKDGEDKGEGQGDSGGEPCPDCRGGNGQGSMDEHDWKSAQGLDERAQRELADAVDAAIRQGAILAGNQDGNTPREFDDLMESKVNWKEQLQEFVVANIKGSDESSYRRPNRRWLQHDIYLPSSYATAVERGVIAVDTSGSVGSDELSKFMSEVVSIFRNVNPECVDLLYWDHHVAGHEVYDRDSADQMLTSTRPAGGGGTSPSCVSEYLNEKKIKPQFVIVLTDGYVGSDWGSNWPCPVLWAIVGNKGTRADNGVTIHID